MMAIGDSKPGLGGSAWWLAGDGISDQGFVWHLYSVGGYFVTVESDGPRPDDYVTHSWHAEASSQFAAQYHHGIQDPHRQSAVCAARLLIYLFTR